jgi:hypothetical protein
MNIRLVQFSLGPGKRSVAEAIADKSCLSSECRKGAIDVNSSLIMKLATMGSSSYGRRNKLLMLPLR